MGHQPPPNLKQHCIGTVALQTVAGGRWPRRQTSVVLTTKDRVLDTWKHIQEAEAKEDILLGKIQENLDKMDAVISPACNIQKRIKEDLLKVTSLMTRITSSK